MSCTTLTKSSSPATQALEMSLNETRFPSITESNKPMICTQRLKRSRSAMGSFDMSVFVEASQQLEDSIAFPSIEFPTFDSDDEEEYASPPAAKRRCRGLTRTKNISSDLSSLGSSERFGSYGSLC